MLDNGGGSSVWESRRLLDEVEVDDGKGGRKLVSVVSDFRDEGKVEEWTEEEAVDEPGNAVDDAERGEGIWCSMAPELDVMASLLCGSGK